MYGPDGTPAGDEIPVSGTGDCLTPTDIDWAAWGGFGVAWIGEGMVRARLFGSDGAAVTDEIPVPSVGEAEQSNPAISMTTDGFVVVWAQPDAILGTRFRSDGTPVSDVRVWDSEDSEARWPSVCAYPGHGFVIAWGIFDTSEDSGEVVGRWYYESGASTSGPYGLGSDPAGGGLWPAVDMAANGSVRAVWHFHGGDDSGIAFRTFLGEASPAGEERRIDAYEEGHQAFPRVSVHSDGRAAACWVSDGQDGDGYGIFCQRLDASGSPLGLLAW